MHALEQRSYFFDAGIRFACRRCGACCRGAPGLVRVDDREIVEIATLLDVSIPRLIRRCLEVWGNGYRIREHADGRCHFFDRGCRIYPVRPAQCRTFPFWFANLRSEARWASVSRACPGIGTGRLYTRQAIMDRLSVDTRGEWL